jgi:hypothetical protein
MESASHSRSFDLEYLHCICNTADTIVADGLSQNKKRQAEIETRMNYYKVYLKQNDFRGNKHHPFVKEIIRLMNKDRAIRISDRLLLLVSNKMDYKVYLFMNKFIIRIKNPSLIMKDIMRSHI